LNSAKSVKAAIRAAFGASIAAKRAFLRRNIDALATVVNLTATTLARGNKILLFGNGGSAADAQHIAAEFVNRFRRDRQPLPAIALTTDTSILTSIANDYGYRDVFAKQVEALGQPGDLAFALSTSGNSPSVIRGIERCAKLGMATVGLTGGSGGKMVRKVDHPLVVSATRDTARIQETHILIAHVICELVEESFCRAGAR